MSLNPGHAVWLIMEFSLSMKLQSAPLAFSIHFDSHSNLEPSPLHAALEISPSLRTFFWCLPQTHVRVESSPVKVVTAHVHQYKFGAT
jgi:hypothetical protein